MLAVLDALVARLAAGGAPAAHGLQPVLLAPGQCVDGHGTSKAYMPLLEALGRLCLQSTSGARPRSYAVWQRRACCSAV